MHCAALHFFCAIPIPSGTEYNRNDSAARLHCRIGIVYRSRPLRSPTTRAGFYLFCTHKLPLQLIPTLHTGDCLYSLAHCSRSERRNRTRRPILYSGIFFWYIKFRMLPFEMLRNSAAASIVTKLPCSSSMNAAIPSNINYQYLVALLCNHIKSRMSR